MDYWSLYETLIRKAGRRSLRGIYFERHHIIPRCLDGDNSAENIVKLTYREHFLAHWLLIKMFAGEKRRRMTYAFHAMSLRTEQRQITAWQYEVIKRHLKDQGLETRKKRREFRLALRHQKNGATYEEAMALVSRPYDELSEREKLRFVRLAMKHTRVSTVATKHRRHIYNRGDPIADVVHKVTRAGQTHEERLARWKARREQREPTID